MTQIQPHHHTIEKLENMADWMDSKFQLPGTSIRFGFDSILGLIPGIGDTITAASTLYLLGHAHNMGVPTRIKALMIWNALVDWIVGSIPLLGDIFDIGWKANRKNVALLKQHIHDTMTTTV